MKIGILTFHSAVNYGAVLQAYGLQEYLKSLGHDVYLIDYRPLYLSDPYNVFMWNWDKKLSAIRNILLLIRNLVVLPIRVLRRYRFKRFVRRFLSISPHLILYDKNSDFDAFIFGSDQIWNPNITRGLDRIFFGCFPAARNKRLVSYAASAGSIGNIEFVGKDFLSLLSTYTDIGVRERTIANYIHQHSSLLCRVTLDPVLLAGRAVFDSIALRQSVHRPYLLVFRLLWSTGTTIVDEIAKEIAKKRNLKIVELVSLESIRNLRSIASASPERFLSLFRYADYIITTSYHGTVFSILFEKDFNVVALDNSIERMKCLLSNGDLDDRIIYGESDNIVSNRVDYDKVNTNLQDLRACSGSFIHQALKSVVI